MKAAKEDAMKAQNWIFSVCYYAPKGRARRAVVGRAHPSTVEAALHLVGCPEAARAEIRADATVRLFVEGCLDPEETGYFVSPMRTAWCVCIGPVHEVMQ